MEFSTGAFESPKDNKRIYHDELKTLAGLINSVGGVKYEASEIEHQHKVGICTAISITQNARKAIGRKFSADFQYLLQKKFIDLNWIEGSSVLSALKIGKNYGFLPDELFCDSKGKAYVTENDRLLSYDQYIEKLKAISDEEIKRLISLASDYKLKGYAQVDQSDSDAIARSINASKAGVLCMFRVGKEWYTAKDGTVTWDAAKINPIQPPKEVISGHAITGANYNFVTANLEISVANTWGPTWCLSGSGTTYYSNYKPVEVWIPYYDMTEEQLKDLKKTLESKISLMQKLLDAIKQLKSLIKK